MWQKVCWWNEHLCKHRLNLRHLHEKSKLAQHAYAGSLSIGLDEARISEIGSNRRYKKYHKSALNTLFGNLPHTSKEAGNLSGWSVWYDKLLVGIYLIFISMLNFCSTDGAGGRQVLYKLWFSSTLMCLDLAVGLVWWIYFLLFHLSFGSSCALSEFSMCIFLLSPFEKSQSEMCT